MSSTPVTTAYGSASPRPAGSAIGQAVKQAPHLVQASSMSSTRPVRACSNPAVLHRTRIAQNWGDGEHGPVAAVVTNYFWIAATALRTTSFGVR